MQSKIPQSTRPRWAQVYNPGDRWYDLDTAMNVDFGGRYFEGGTADWDYPS
ncbi:MAG: hypothetical protein PHY59_00685 [Methanobacterium sp.]|nr:hypothetical protein [Methanobacterium sp.]